jgi:sugar phosphate isomerase/epimerase
MKYAVCNETFEGWDHARVCGRIAELGYTGLEIAPFTLASRITDVSSAKRAELRKTAEAAGVSIVGLHWLLAKTEGFCLTSPDPTVRKTTAAYFAALAEACAELGGWVLVLGSPLQRKVPAGHTKVQAAEFALDTIRQFLPALERTKTTLALEPLGPQETDFLNTAAEGDDLIRRLGHPNVKLHLDVKAMSTEAMPVPDVIRNHIANTVHFHANDPNRRGPGFGDTDFKPIFKALKDEKYNGWVSVEVFDYSPDPDTIARESIRYMRECENAI